jgi:very-short-patch-repair endonuclease
VLPDLEALATEAPELQPPEIGDFDDPRPWLEAYDAGVGSPLELKFLRMFEKHRIKLEKQVPVAPDSHSPPISQADFRVIDTNILIYVDGAAFHVGARLRRDRFIRERLRSGEIGWEVLEFRAIDLRDPSRVVSMITEN